MHNSFPSPYGNVIASLKRGQEIVIKAGFGYPRFSVDTTKIIWKVEQMSAITTDGTLLACDDGRGVIPVVKFHAKVHPTWYARRIVFLMWVRRMWEDVTSPIIMFFQRVEFKIWMWKHHRKSSRKAN